MAKQKRGNGKTMDAKRVESIRHKDKRANIPTEELRDFVAEDEKAPKTMLYPRDPPLDPQLVWKGKDEQDQRDLAVPVVPVYIQEKIHPQAIIEDLVAHPPSGVKAQPRAAGPRRTALPLRRLQRPRRRLRQEGRFLPARAKLDQPHDSRRLAAGDDFSG